jgi:hypothetical protein
LVGSVALGDFRPRSSDIDFVAVTATCPSPAALAGLARVHDRLRQRPFFDGGYLTWTDLAGPAEAARPGPHVREGRLHLPGRFRRAAPCYPDGDARCGASVGRHDACRPTTEGGRQ